MKDPQAQQKRAANLKRKAAEMEKENPFDGLMPTDPLMIPPWFA